MRHEGLRRKRGGNVIDPSHDCSFLSRDRNHAASRIYCKVLKRWPLDHVGPVFNRSNDGLETRPTFIERAFSVRRRAVVALVFSLLPIVPGASANSTADARAISSTNTTTNPGDSVACCCPNGSCNDATPEFCTAQGCAPGEAGTSCETTFCGACCTGDGCVPSSFASCASSGNCFQGAGTVCSSELCTRACCLPDGQCAELSSCDCVEQGGLFQPPGVDCADQPCPQACCLASLPGCLNLTGTFCTLLGGVPGGNGSDCSTSECILPCCCANPELGCSLMSVGTCSQQGCSVIPGGSCDQPDCNANGISDICDLRLGGATDFNTNGIPDECDVGACCRDTALAPPYCASSVTPADCLDGRFLLDRTCEENPFEPACGLGSCCASDGSCADATLSECGAVDGIWLQFSSCESGPDFCPPAACLSTDWPCDQVNDNAPGCGSPFCCQAICEVDSFCCDVSWDTFCVDSALANCRRACCVPTAVQCGFFEIDFCTTHGGTPLSLNDECDEPDCNGNGVNDACDVIVGSSADCNGNDTPDDCEFRGDFDEDGDVDLSDYAHWPDCLTGPSVTAPPCTCAPADLRLDHHIDLFDYSLMLGLFDPD